MGITSNKIKSQVFKAIANNILNRNILSKEAVMIKEKRDKKMADYSELDKSAINEHERNMILEKANTVLLQYNQKIKMADLYSKRSKAFMNCLIAIEKNDMEEYRKRVLEFAEEIKEQVLEYKRMELDESRQKKIALYATKSWLRVLEKEDYSRWKASSEKNEIQETIKKENMKFFELGEEEHILKSKINDTNIQIRRTDFDTLDLINISPLKSIGKIYPDINKDFLDLNAQRAKISK